MEKALGRNRYAILTCGICTLIMLGMLYGWSIFVPPLEAEFGWSRSQTSFAFSVAMVMWSVGMLANGQLAKRLPVRVRFCIATGCLVLGFFLCRFITSLPQLYLFYGALCGFGSGMSLNLWVSTITAWFSDKVGFANGILLMGFGMGSMILGSAVSALIYSPLGWRNAFSVLAAAILVEGAIALWFLREPTESERRQHAKRAGGGLELTGSQVLREPSFWAFVVWRVLPMGVASAIIAQTSVMMIGMGASTATAALAVGCLGVGNGFGRPIFGVIFDRLGTARTMIILSAGTCMISVLFIVSFMMHAMLLLAVSIFIEGVFYGGYAAVGNSFLRGAYGQPSLSMNMGLASMCLLPFNVIIPMLAAFIFDATGDYLVFFYVVPILSVVALSAGLLIKPTLARMEQKHKGSTEPSDAAVRV